MTENLNKHDESRFTNQNTHRDHADENTENQLPDIKGAQALTHDEFMRIRDGYAKQMPLF